MVKYFGDRVDPVAAGTEDQKPRAAKRVHAHRQLITRFRRVRSRKLSVFFLPAKCKHGDERRRVDTVRLFYLLVRPIDAKSHRH